MTHGSFISLKTTDFRDSKLFGKAPQDVVNILSTEPVTANFHQFCITKEVIITCPTYKFKLKL